MSELLKLYVQNNERIPIHQLGKLDNNLLKTYYRSHADFVKRMINSHISVFYVKKFYRFLDEKYIRKNINALLEYYHEVNSDIQNAMKSELSKLIYQNDTKTEYFANEFLEILEKNGFEYIFNNLITNDKEINRIEFLIYVISGSFEDNPDGLRKYIQTLNDKDMHQIIKTNIKNFGVLDFLFNLFIEEIGINKFDDNLLKIYYWFKKDEIDNDIMDGIINDKVIVLYKFLDDDIKKMVLDLITFYAGTQYPHKFFDTELMKEYYLERSENIKKIINDIDISETINKDVINRLFSYLKRFIKYFDSDFLENIHKKLVQHYLNISRQSNKKYFALNMLKILNEIDIVKFINSWYFYNELNNTDNYDDVDDIGKRIQFLYYVIYNFENYQPYKLKKYSDIINEKDLVELIKKEYSEFFVIEDLIKSIPSVFHEKFPQVFLDLIKKNEKEMLELLMPLNFIRKNGLLEKYNKYVETAADYAWKEIKKDIFESGFIPSKYRLMSMIQNVGSIIRYLYLNYNDDFFREVQSKLIEYYEDEKESLNLK